MRGAGNSFPFVAELVRLAGDVRALLGPATKLTYGADWSEYFGYHPPDGSGEVFFHLDQLWASPAIDAVGIDNYMPLSDWRDSDLGGGNPDGARLADDKSAMTAAIASGEGYDWYYASGADRQNRVRLPITDGLSGKPWVFRYKDLVNWWSNPHFNRTGGAEQAVATPWVPGSKPIWFTELGCPAIDKGANQPNVFVDPKSSESTRPHFSNGARSDSMQRRFLEAHFDWWLGGGAPQGMVDPEHIFVWTWDARPYPAFPNNLWVWSDGDNWRTGHWLTGRLGATTLADAIAAILHDHGFPEHDVSQVSGDLIGYIQADTTSARALIEPLASAYLLDVKEDGGRLVFRSRTKAALAAQVIDVLAEREDESAWSEMRGHDSDFAAEVVASFANPLLDYEQASVRSRRAGTSSNRMLRADLAGVLYEEAALTLVEALLRDNHLSRRSLSFPLSPAMVSLEAGDAIRLSEGPDGVYVVTRIEDGEVRRVEARRHEPAAVLAAAPSAPGRTAGTNASSGFSPVVHLLDLPRFESGEAQAFARGAVYGRPWRRVLFSSSLGTEAYRSRAAVDRPARTGRLSADLQAGVWGRFDRSGAIEIDLSFGGLSSSDETSVLSGTNRIAVQCASGSWEVLGFAMAEETAPNHWRLSQLLRGLSGTEDGMAAGAPAGSPVVVLDEAVVPLGLTVDERGIAQNWLVEALGTGGGQAGPFSFAGGLRAETPLAPVHARCRRQAGGVAFSWVRRARSDAYDWAATDIPLDEPEDRYRLELMAGVTVMRSVDVAGPFYLYTDSLELNDFGAAQTSFRIRLRQLGRAVPLGIALETNIPVKREGDA